MNKSSDDISTGQGDRPPGFLGEGVGDRLHALQSASAPWVVSRAISSPDLTQRLLHGEPGFALLPRASIEAAANTLAFLFQHTQTWRLAWVESVAGPSHFKDSRKVRVGLSNTTMIELARTAGIEVEGSGSIVVADISAEVTAKWSKLTQSTVTIDVEEEFTRVLDFDIPPGGMDIALWQLESQLTRRLVLRPGLQLPPDPLPRWVESALAAQICSVTLASAVTQSVIRAGA